MKKHIILLAMLSPLTVMASESTDYKTENELCTNIIPSIAKSGKVTEIILIPNNNKFDAQKQSINCKYKASALDDHGTPGPVKLTAAIDMSTYKAHIEWGKEETAPAIDDRQLCLNLVKDITHRYEYSSLQLIFNSHTPNNAYVNCVYSAVSHEPYGNIPVQLTTTLNTANNTYSIRLH